MDIDVARRAGLVPGLGRGALPGRLPGLLPGRDLEGDAETGQCYPPDMRGAWVGGLAAQPQVDGAVVVMQVGGVDTAKVEALHGDDIRPWATACLAGPCLTGCASAPRGHVGVRLLGPRLPLQGEPGELGQALASLGVASLEAHRHALMPTAHAIANLKVLLDSGKKTIGLIPDWERSSRPGFGKDVIAWYSLVKRDLVPYPAHLTTFSSAVTQVLASRPDPVTDGALRREMFTGIALLEGIIDTLSAPSP